MRVFLITERTSEIRMGTYVFLLFRFVYFRRRKVDRSETSMEYLKHRGENGKVIAAHIIKAYTGVEVQLHSTLMLARNGGEWSAPRLGHITAMERPSIVNEYEAK